MRLKIGLVALAALLAGVRVLNAAEPQLAHMVFFTLADDTPANRERLVTACQEHLTKHEGTVHFSAGARIDVLKRDVNDQAFDVALHLVFVDKKAHDKYQTHPRHLQFIKENKELWSKVRVFDSFIPSPAKQVTAVEEALSVPLDFDVEKQPSFQTAFEAIRDAYADKHRLKGRLVSFSIDARALQAEGITRNQRVSDLETRGKTLAELLTALVSKANPIGGAALDGKRQKIVWVVDPAEEAILITTRSGAKKKSLELPKAFQPKVAP